MANTDKASHGTDAMREAARVLLSAPLNGEREGDMVELLRQLGLEPDQQSAILLQLIYKAKEGDFRSIQMVRELTEAEEGKDGPSFAADLRSLSTEELERMLVDPE